MKRSPLFRLFLLLALALSAGAAWAQSDPKFESLGDDTYTVSVHATHKFTRNTKKLTALAIEAAEAFCAKDGKVMKLVSTDDKRGMYGVGGFATATITFKALPPGAAELATAQSQQPQVRAPLPATPTDSLYDELLKLDDLRKRGILTDEEFDAEKKKVLARSK
ncbi:MAG TPA: SHOCT domain-containing protein [Opitutaceae bacterium]